MSLAISAVVFVFAVIVASFVFGVLFGRKNVKKVEAAVAVAKDPKSLL